MASWREPGLYNDVPAEEYHAGPGLSKSDLDLVHRSPAHYRAGRTQEREETPQMRFGTAVHSAILEPESWARDYVAAPEGADRRTKVYKKWAAEVDPAAIILSHDEYSRALAIRDAVLTHDFAGVLLDPDDPGSAECSLYWWRPVWVDSEHARERIYCKARPDKLNAGHRLVVDLKTAADASYSGFASAVIRFRYGVSAAWYLDGALALGLEMQDYVYVVVEPEPPFAVGCYRLPDDYMAHARTVAEHDLHRFAQCLVHDEWPSYDGSVRTLSFPEYAYRERAA